MIVKNDSPNVYILHGVGANLQLYPWQIAEIPETYQDDPTFRLGVDAGELIPVPGADKPWSQMKRELDSAPAQVVSVEEIPAAEVQEAAEEAPAEETISSDSGKKSTRKKSGDAQ